MNWQFTLGMIINFLGDAMPASMWREPRSEVKSSGSAVIQDNGVLTAGVPSSTTRNYLFTEVMVGAHALVLIGNKAEVLHWLSQRANNGIDNRIVELPSIYMSVQPYKPGARFVGLFPLEAAVQRLVEGVAAAAPGSKITDVAGGMKDLKGAIEFSKGGFFSSIFSESEVDPAPNPGNLYIRFHYLKGDHDTKVGEKFVAFSAVAKILEAVIRD